MTKEENHAAMRAVFAISEAVRTAVEIHAGTVFAAVCQFVAVDTFDSVIERLVNAKLVERTPAHLLRWVGPNHAKGTP